MAQAMYGQRSGQSNIETAMSLPRPDPAQLWMAQQQVGAHQPKRNTGVLILVVALVALSIIGIGVLVYFKLKAPPPSPTVAPDASATPSAVVPAATTPAPTATPTPTPAATESAAPVEQPQAATASPATVPAGTGKPAGTTTAAPTASAAAPAGGGEPGFLTIVCNPFCDSVLDNGRSLGPSPVVHVPASPGSHRITLKKGTMTKTISVIVVSGQVTAQRVSMK